MLLDLPQNVICSVARFRLRVHTLRFEQQLGIPPVPLLATCVRLMMMSRMINMHVLFHCTHPQMVSLRKK